MVQHNACNNPSPYICYRYEIFYNNTVINITNLYVKSDKALVQYLITATDVWRWALKGIMLDHRPTALYGQEIFGRLSIKFGITFYID